MFFVSFMDLLSEIFKGIVGALIIASAIYFLMIGLEKINEFSDEVKKKGTKGSRLRCYAAVMVGDDEATLKRVRLYPDHLVLEPENPLYKPMVFWEEEMNTVRIIGKATHFISRVR